ncbi:MAG: hypothetical protein QW734_04635 [Candidatus Bathyarchaeia archaeon]
MASILVKHRAVKQPEEILYAVEWNDEHSVSIEDDVDFNHHQALNMIIHSVDGLPESGIEGQIVYNLQDRHLYVYVPV